MTSIPATIEQISAALASRYLIERELGQGGMATVYLARDLKHARLVAIKLLRPELATALGPERFLREIQVAAAFNHPHILALHDSGTAEGLLYYVMPYVEGSLCAIGFSATGSSPSMMPCHYGQVLSALGYAHQHGMVHRDIKPENILISGEHSFVADFGIARAVDVAGGEKLTETGLALGTPAYMSPEQAAGDRATWTAAATSTSLGCVLYEMLAGEPPFTGPSAQAILARHAVDQVAPLRTVRRTVPEGMEQASCGHWRKCPPIASLRPSSSVARSRRESRRPGSRPRVRSSRRIAAGTAAAVSAIALAVGAFLRRHSPRGGRRS